VRKGAGGKPRGACIGQPRVERSGRRPGDPGKVPGQEQASPTGTRPPPNREPERLSPGLSVRRDDPLRGPCPVATRPLAVGVGEEPGFLLGPELGGPPPPRLESSLDTARGPSAPSERHLVRPREAAGCDGGRSPEAHARRGRAGARAGGTVPP